MSTGPMVGGEIELLPVPQGGGMGWTAAPPVTSGATYLRQVEELRGEIEDAMQAISGNQLGVLEESLWRQQVLCTSLKHLSQTLGEEETSGPLMRRIREASVRLAEVNRVYAHLVEQSAGSTELLLRLCRSYRERNESSGTGASRSAWTCEA